MNSARTGRMIAGGIVALILVALTVVVAVDVRLPQLSNQHPVEGIGFLVAFVACALTGAVILLRQPRHTVGWILAIIGLLPMIAVPLERWGTYKMITDGAPDAATYLGFWMNSWYWYLLIGLILVFLPLLFPTGRLPSPRWRLAASVPTIGLVAMVVLGALHPTIGSQEERSITIANPIGVPGLAHVEDSTLGSALFGALLAGMLLAIAAIVVRFRRARGVERQQMKWFFVPALALPLDFVVASLGLPDVVAALAMPTTVAAFPVAIGIAITRYRLYDLGRLVSRTVTYAIVIGVLVALYAGTVLLLGAASRQILGEQNDLVVAVSTLLAAAAFQPLRRRVQRLVDRRFNRSRYDAAHTVERFGSQLRDEVDLDAVAAHLRQAATEALRPSSTLVWVRGGQP